MSDLPSVDLREIDGFVWVVLTWWGREPHSEYTRLCERSDVEAYLRVKSDFLAKGYRVWDRTDLHIHHTGYGEPDLAGAS